MTHLSIPVMSWYAPANDEICLCGIGARTPLGFGAAASAAAVRGAISAIAIHPSLVDKAEEPMALAWDPGLDPAFPIAARIRQLLVSAIAEALGDRAPALAGAHVQCWIGLPEARPGLPSSVAMGVSMAVCSTFGFAASAVHLISRGHAAGLMALQLAAETVAVGKAEFAVAAGVDSYFDAMTLAWLDRTGVLMSSKNRNGFPPGEAAGACLLARRSTAKRHGLPILARVTAAATSVEPHPIRSAGVCIGEGLSAAINGVVSSLDLPRHAITATYCDLNGERYRSEEFMYTLLRVQMAFVDAHKYQSPADCWGDVGAASGLLFAGLALASYQRGYATGQYPVLWAGSTRGHRTAVVLSLGDS